MPVNPASFNLLTTLYSDRPMMEIWSEAAIIDSWLRTEAELARAQAELGFIHHSDAEAIAAACVASNVDHEQLWRDSRNVGYPILPLVRQIAETLPDGPNGRLHYGATTQDVMDTGLALQLGATCEHLDVLLTSLGDALNDLTKKYATTVMAGRTHAQHAVPTTFGAKMAVFLDEVRRERDLIRQRGNDAMVVSLFGAGGTAAALGKDSAHLRAVLARRLGLANSEVPWHVARGRVVRLGMSMATIAELCVRFAREIVDLSRTEIAEVREPAGHHRGASSTMPQKANPISAESIIGLGASAATITPALLRTLESGHERAAGEWQIEWFALPTLCVLTAAAIAQSAELAKSLQVFPNVMRHNLDAEFGLIMSEAAMMRLAPAIGREKAHDIVYAAASQGRADQTSLADALRVILPEHLFEIVGSLEPTAYLGEAEQICAVAVSTWEQANAIPLARSGEGS